MTNANIIGKNEKKEQGWEVIMKKWLSIEEALTKLKLRLIDLLDLASEEAVGLYFYDNPYSIPKQYITDLNEACYKTQITIKAMKYTQRLNPKNYYKIESSVARELTLLRSSHDLAMETFGYIRTKYETTEDPNFLIETENTEKPLHLEFWPRTLVYKQTSTDLFIFPSRTITLSKVYLKSNEIEQIGAAQRAPKNASSKSKETYTQVLEASLHHLISELNLLNSKALIKNDLTPQQERDDAEGTSSQILKLLKKSSFNVSELTRQLDDKSTFYFLADDFSNTTTTKPGFSVKTIEAKLQQFRSKMF